MRRLLPLLALAAILTPTARGDESDEMQLEFIRKLRDRGYAALSLEYVDILARQKRPGLVDKLPIEAARSRSALARQRDPAQREPLFAEARRDLEAFLRAHPSSPQAAQARVELARVTAQQGQALLSQALRLEDEKDDKAAAQTARRAEHFFADAGKQLEAAAKQLTDPAERQRVQLERGQNFLDQARTHPRDRRRAELIAEAQKTLEALEVEIAGKGKPPPEASANPTLHLARAWLVRCYHQGDQPDKAAEKYKLVSRETAPEAAAGQRWAWYFRIQHLPEDIKSKVSEAGRLKQVQKECLDWLKAYPGHHGAPEGLGVRFELARAYLNEAQAVSKDPSHPKAAALYELAQRELTTLAASASDFAEKANQLHLGISFHRIAADKTPLTQVRDFQQCYLRGRYELSRMQEAAIRASKTTGEERAEAEKDRAARLAAAIAALRRCVALAPPSGHKDVTEARYLLTFLYLLAGDPHRAAVAGEDLGRERPPTRRSAAAAGYALQAYGDIVAATKSANDRARLSELARYILDEGGAAWSGDPVTQVARYQLAQLALRDREYGTAIDHLEKIAPDFAGYLYTQAQLVMTAAAARADENATPEAQAALQKRAEAALARMPPLPEGADTTTAQMYFAAQLEKGNYLYAGASALAAAGKADQAGKAFADLDKFHAWLQKEYGKHGDRFNPDNQAEFVFALARLKNLARYGVAQAEYRAGNYDRVLSAECAGAVLDAVRKQAAKVKPGEPIRVNDSQLTGEVLGLAMRARVQKGELAGARELLALVRRLAGEDGEAGVAAGVLQSLVEELKVQVRELRDRQDKQKLEVTVKNFSAFLDELAKEPGRQGTPEQVLFLANCYASLDKHAEAARLYAEIPEPKIDPKKSKLSPEEERELKTYWLMQVNYGRALRHGKDFKGAKKVLDRAVTDPRGYGAFLAEKELIHLLEDQGLYGKAVTQWGKFQQHPALQRAISQLGSLDAAEQRRIKELFYDCVYQYAYCLFKYGETNKKDVYIQRAAERIVAIEENAEAWALVGDRCRELLRSDERLRTEYEKKKKAGK